MPSVTLRPLSLVSPNLIIYRKNCFSLFQIDLITIFHLEKIDTKQNYLTKNVLKHKHRAEHDVLGV